MVLRPSFYCIILLPILVLIPCVEFDSRLNLKWLTGLILCHLIECFIFVLLKRDFKKARFVQKDSVKIDTRQVSKKMYQGAHKPGSVPRGLPQGDGYSSGLCFTTKL